MKLPPPTKVPFVPLAAMGICLLAPLPRSQKPEGLRERAQTLRVVEPEAGERDLKLTPVVRAVQRAADSVVSIYLQSDVSLVGRGPVTEGQGSGVILDESGLVITNWHVVAPLLHGGQDHLDVEIKLRDGRARAATVLSTSATRDLALLQMRLEADEKVKPAEIGRSADLMIGETLVAIGNPQGHANTVTSGVLSAVGRKIQVRAPDRVREYADLLQTDAAINQGNSGGALLDITGKLVGINSAMAMGAENIGFAIPMDIVREVFEKELVRSTSFAHAADAAWLGLEVGEHDGSVVVTGVEPESPAERAGIKKGDVLARVAGQGVQTTLDYQRQLVAARAWQPFAIALRRGGRNLEVAPVPTTTVHRDVLAAIGVELEEIRADKDPELVRKVTIAFYAESGMRRVAMLPSALRISTIQPDSPAADIGLQTGDLLLASIRPGRLGMEEQPLFSARALLNLLVQREARSGLRIAILRGDTTLEGTVHVRPLPPR
jgi:serine protease Do